MKTGVGIFAKTRGLSPVKTRLAADIGQPEAEKFYELSVACIHEVVAEWQKSSEFVSPVWALAEEEATRLAEWQSFERVWTGSGNLGERLANVSDHLFQSNEAAMFIGTDSPQLSPKHLQSAIDHLSQNREKVVIGPAKDGGFYLLLSAKPVPREVWEQVIYSKSTTLNDLVSRLQQAGFEPLYLPNEQDVDTLEDLMTLKASLRLSERQLMPKQLELLSWLLTTINARG